MLNIEKNVLLTPYTTLKIGSRAEFFAVIKSRADLDLALQWAKASKQKIWILGGGSNILISQKIKGLVLKNEIKGLQVVSQDDKQIFVEAMSGEAWTKLVNFTVERNFYGLENLFLIYGTVGAAPVQNIGAYGVELKDVFFHLKAINLKTGQERIFSRADCKFAYRDSIFKHGLKGKYFIYSVTLKLQRQPNLKLAYGSIKEELAKKNIKNPSLRQVVAVITEIRNSKLPNPGQLPNAGSFFKNVEISRVTAKRLLKKYPQMPQFPAPGQKIKIPSAWLIEQVGFKGRRIGQVALYDKQPLVLVNHGRASAREVLNFTKKVKAAVKRKFGLDLVEEVNII